MRQIRKYQKDKGRILHSNKLLYHSVPIGCILALLLLSIITINPTISNNGNIALAIDSANTGSTASNKDISANVNNLNGNNGSSLSDNSNGPGSTNIGNNTNSLDSTSSSVGNSNSNNDNNADNDNVSNGDGVANSTSNVDITNVEGEGDGDGDAGIAPLADLTSDGVTLVWNSSDDPIQSTYGDSSTVLYRYNRFNVTADNIKQYQILANVVDNANGSNGNKLIGYTSTDSTNTNGASIDAISNTNGIVGKELASTTTSQWGYTIADGEVTNETNLANLTYKAVPAASSSTIGKTEAVTSLNNRAFTIAFAANIADDKPAGSYRTNVEVSVVVEPGKLTEFPISNMQDMTSSICDSVEVGTTKQLKDTRDQKYYWVTKIQNSANKNETCWMTQNLDLDITAAGLSKNDSDITIDWNSASIYKPVAMQTVTSGFGAENDDSLVASYNPGNKYCSNNYIDGGCNMTSSNNNGHDSVGNYYTFTAATAGTGGGLSSGNASGSICPKGWQLPSESGSTSYKGMLADGNISQGTQLISDPYYFVYAGRLQSDGLYRQNSEGAYLSSSVSRYIGKYPSFLFFFNTTATVGEVLGYRSTGMSVRCVAR